MKIINIKQNTPEWHAYRRLHIGSSDCAAIMGEGMFGKTALKVFWEKADGEQVAETEAMKHGNETEAEARSYFSKKYNTNWEAKVGESDERHFLMASFDGWDGNRVLEIKCPKSESSFNDVRLSGKPPKGYLWQVQHQLMVSGADSALLGFYYKGLNGIETFEMAIHRDEAMIADLIKEEEAFWLNNVIKMVPPKTSREDYILREDFEWGMAEEAWYELYAEQKAIEEKLEAARLHLVRLSGNNSCRGSRAMVTKIAKEGAIQFGDIPEVKQLTAEYKNRFRKAASVQFRVSAI